MPVIALGHARLLFAPEGNAWEGPEGGPLPLLFLGNHSLIAMIMIMIKTAGAGRGCAPRQLQPERLRLRIRWWRRRLARTAPRLLGQHVHGCRAGAAISAGLGQPYLILCMHARAVMHAHDIMYVDAHRGPVYLATCA